jgi:hypothetical protein
MIVSRRFLSGSESPPQLRVLSSYPGFLKFDT